MKNKICIATMIALGLGVVSCSADTEEMNATSTKSDSISINKTIINPLATDDIVLPPIKPE